MTGNKVILIGGFHEIIELCEISNRDIVGIIDNQLPGEYYGYRVLGKDEDAKKILDTFQNIPVLFCPDKPDIRSKLRTIYKFAGVPFCNLIHPSAVISRSAQLGSGIIIQRGVHISSGAIVQDFVKVNVGANIMHDCVIGEFTTVAPSALLLGRVKVGKMSYIGGHATILPGIIIGDGVMVGAGAVVTKNVGDHQTVKGNPAK